jgi:prepilin-type N-terminal cleavage/methylation domain-containing protein
MGARVHNIRSAGGFSLIELVVVLALVGLGVLIGAGTVAQGLGAREARGQAQAWQAAASWAQVEVLWQGGSTELLSTPERAGVAQNGSRFGEVWGSALDVAVSTNLARWRQGRGVSVAFDEPFAAPNGGGSLYFQAGGRSYRVLVRPESGLTARSLGEPAP